MPPDSFPTSAGVIARDCLRATALLRLVPSLLFFTASAAAAVYLAALVRLPGSLQLLLAAVAVGPVLGFEALRERDGAAPALGDAAGFALRYGFVALFFGVPIALVSEVAVVPHVGALHPLLPAAVPGLVGVVVAAGAALATGGFALLVAAAGREPADALSPEIWRRTVAERAADLPAFWAVALGSGVLAALVAVPLALLSAPIAAALNARAGIWLMLLAWSSPLAFGALFAARLAGAFVAVEPRQLQTAAPRATVSAPAYTPRAKKPAEPTPRVVDAMDLVRAIQELPAKGETDLPGAIAEAEALLLEQPKAAGVMAELAKLYRKSGRDTDAVELAGRAITVALRGGMSPVAVAVYKSFAGDRDRLGLAEPVRAQLGKTLAAQGHAADAAFFLTDR